MLTENNWKIINKLALLLALAESLDYSEASLVHAVAPYVTKKCAVLDILPMICLVLKCIKSKHIFPGSKKL